MKQILAELPKLTPTARRKIRERLAVLDGESWLDSDDPLTSADKTLIESRMKDHEKNPNAAIPLDKFDARLKRRLAKR